MITENDIDCNLLWRWHWSAHKHKAWIVNANGFTVLQPTLSASQARELCRLHNQNIVTAANDGAGNNT